MVMCELPMPVMRTGGGSWSGGGKACMPCIGGMPDCASRRGALTRSRPARLHNMQTTVLRLEGAENGGAGTVQEVHAASGAYSGSPNRYDVGRGFGRNSEARLSRQGLEVRYVRSREQGTRAKVL